MDLKSIPKWILEMMVMALGQQSGNFFNHYPKIFFFKLILPHGKEQKNKKQIASF
jgi:hypothetical protein